MRCNKRNNTSEAMVDALPPNKRTKVDPAMRNGDPMNMLQQDIWMHILSYVGPGHFAYVAGVSHQMKDWYTQSCDTSTEEPPEVYADDNEDGEKRPATSSDTFYSAAFSSVACADYWREDTKGDENQHLEDHRVCRVVTRYGDLKVLKWARYQGYEWDDFTCQEAANHGHLAMLKYLHENGCQWNEYTCEGAAENGKLECLKYAHQNGCAWDEDTCAYAAVNANLDCLVYAHENGCRWNEKTCSWAARKGHLQVLKYAHTNGCLWNENTCFMAAWSGNLECLEYARAEGCPWDSRAYRCAKTKGHEKIAEWVRDNGCPVGTEEQEW